MHVCLSACVIYFEMKIRNENNQMHFFAKRTR